MRALATLHAPDGGWRCDLVVALGNLRCHGVLPGGFHGADRPGPNPIVQRARRHE